MEVNRWPGMVLRICLLLFVLIYGCDEPKPQQSQPQTTGELTTSEFHPAERLQEVQASPQWQALTDSAYSPGEVVHFSNFTLCKLKPRSAQDSSMHILIFADTAYFSWAPFECRPTYVEGKLLDECAAYRINKGNSYGRSVLDVRFADVPLSEREDYLEKMFSDYLLSKEELLTADCEAWGFRLGKYLDTTLSELAEKGVPVFRAPNGFLVAEYPDHKEGIRYEVYINFKE